MTHSFQPSEEARKWAAKNFAKPLRPVAEIVGQTLATFELDPGKTVKLSQVGPGSEFVADLKFDSLDSAEYIFDLQDAIGFAISDEIFQEKIIDVRGLVIAVYKLIDPDDTQLLFRR